ncbi:hypothetical protein QN277_026496 [Acacia crassicarpa]|uniref:Endonuclease/exonuclease/phosphatase domain-containing protein n=1 Tax=Acacia crassicarpa TaxID=499986 RepID=A0AAE1J9F9_9FABA|nr:hypothetical protein QN277_026496 [Acacia crassicarpa]
MNYLLWNVRGAGARSFPSLIRGMVQEFDINFVAIFETRCGGLRAQRIAGSMGFPNVKIIDADGFKGGIWCLWSDKFRQVEVLCFTSQFVHVRITNHLLQSWEMTFVYGSPHSIPRRALWRDLLQLSHSIQMPWCVGGDFNATLSVDDRCSRSSPCSPDREFCRFLEEGSLNDLGFVGPPFTWRRTGSASRIDRVLGSSSWQDTFPNAVVKHLNWYKSDHRPLLLQLDGCRQKRRGDRPFKFLAAWVLDERFPQFVGANWRNNLTWTENVDQFITACGKWNGQVFGHTSARKRHLLRRLDGITRTETRFGLTTELEGLQSTLWKQLEEVLVQESLLWAQKARSDWLVDGDRNTKFFHSRANGRRKQNFIGALKGHDDIWVYDGDMIKEMVISHFSTVFMEEETQRPPLRCSVL